MKFYLENKQLLQILYASIFKNIKTIQFELIEKFINIKNK